MKILISILAVVVFFPCSLKSESINDLNNILIQCIKFYVVNNKDYKDSFNNMTTVMNLNNFPPQYEVPIKNIDDITLCYSTINDNRYHKNYFKTNDINVISLDSLVINDNILLINFKNCNYRYENQRYIEQGINDYAKFRFEYNCDTEMWDLISSKFTRYPKLYKIKNIEEKQSYNIIYAQRNDSLFKIITPKTGTNNLPASSERIEKDKKYNLDLYPVFPTGSKGEKQVLIYDNDRIKTGKKYHNRIYKANNIDGLFLTPGIK